MCAGEAPYAKLSDQAWPVGYPDGEMDNKSTSHARGPRFDYQLRKIYFIISLNILIILLCINNKKAVHRSTYTLL